MKLKQSGIMLWWKSVNSGLEYWNELTNLLPETVSTHIYRLTDPAFTSKMLQSISTDL